MLRTLVRENHQQVQFMGHQKQRIVDLREHIREQRKQLKCVLQDLVALSEHCMSDVDL
jgi:hypothetical protein